MALGAVAPADVDRLAADVIALPSGRACQIGGKIIGQHVGPARGLVADGIELSAMNCLGDIVVALIEERGCAHENKGHAAGLDDVLRHLLGVKMRDIRCLFTGDDAEEYEPLHARPRRCLDQVAVPRKVDLDAFLHVTVGRADHHINVVQRAVERSGVHHVAAHPFRTRRSIGRRALARHRADRDCGIAQQVRNDLGTQEPGGPHDQHAPWLCGLAGR